MIIKDDGYVAAQTIEYVDELIESSNPWFGSPNGLDQCEWWKITRGLRVCRWDKAKLTCFL